MKVDPRQLAILLAVIREGSLSNAARALGMSQPGVSTAVAQLERSLNVRLLNRGRHGAVPTEAGLLVAHRAEAIEHLLAQTRREIELQSQGVAGPLVVGGTPGALMSLVPGAVSVLQAEFASFELRIVESTDGQVYSQLRKRKIDLAVVTVGLDTTPDDIVEQAVTQDPFQLVLARSHPLSSEVVSLADLTELSWVLPLPGGAFRRHIDALFLMNSIPLPQKVILCDSLATTKEIIRRGEYVTILPMRVVAPETALGVLRTAQLKQVLVTRTLGIRRLKDVYLSPIARAFVTALAPSDHP
jgi:LysR family hydrogen peroxide-inducible transcriptional activator